MSYNPEIGTSGTSGTSGVAGSSGSSGTSGISGTSGSSGTSGIGTSGTSGTSGNSGTSGSSGTSGNSITTSTGVLYGGVASATGGLGTGTSIDLTAGSGVIYDNTIGASATYTLVTWNAASNVAVLNVATQYTYWYIDSAGTLQQTNTTPTRDNYRTRIWLFRTSITGGVITGVAQMEVPIAQQAPSIKDLTSAIGPIRVSGAAPTFSGANLKLKITTGQVFDFGTNIGNSNTDPNVVTIPTFDTAVANTFRYSTTAGTILVDVTDLNFDNYQVAGVVTTVPNNKYTIQYIIGFQGGLVRVLYGNAAFASVSDALVGLSNNDPYACAPASITSSNSFVLGAIIAQKGATTLNTQGTYIVTNKFGAFGGGALSAAGGAFMLTDFSNATGNLPVTLLNGGSGASGSTFWRGDGTWASGPTGTSGTSGTSGVAGSSGSSGTSGTSGVAGTSGTSGTSGVAGTSGTSGVSGTSGSSGSSGTSGSGTSGTSGTSGGGGGTPGGNTTEVQYNSAGAFAGTSNLVIDATDFQPNLLGYSSTSGVAAPSFGGAKIWGDSRVGITQIHVTPDIGIDTILQNSLGLKVVSMLSIGTAFAGTNNFTSVSNAGTAAQIVKTYDATNLLPNYAYQRNTTNATTNTSGELFWSTTGRGAILGNNVYGGGTKWVWTGGFPTYLSTERVFLGYTNTGSQNATTTDPSAWLNMFGVAKDAGDTNLQFMTNAGSGTATKVDTGITANSNDVFRVTLYAPSNATTIYLMLEQITKSGITIAKTSFTGAKVMGGTIIYTHIFVNTAAVASAISIATINLVEEQY